MPQAFVLINVESGAEEDIVKDLKKIEGVERSILLVWRLRYYC